MVTPQAGAMFITTGTQIVKNLQAIVALGIEMDKLLEKSRTEPGEAWTHVKREILGNRIEGERENRDEERNRREQEDERRREGRRGKQERKRRY